MRYLTRTLLLVCALLLVSAYVPEASAAEPVDNIIQYIPEKDWNDTDLTEAERNEKAHTIHWLTGVNPPVMPHELTERDANAVGAFTLIEEGQGKAAHRYYASPYYPGNGWYDVNKYISENGSGRDSHLCFAVAMTNVIHWWMEQNTQYVEHYLAQMPPERAEEKTALENYLYNNLEDGSKNQTVLQNPATSRIYNDVILPPYNGADKGGWPDKPADYFFNGYLPDKDKMERNRPDNLKTPKSPGGVFYDVFGKSILTDNIQSGNYETLNQVMAEYMDSGTGVVIGFNIMGGSHAITLWGAEYDEHGRLCAMYLVDNNDTGVGGTGTYINGELAAMIRYEVVKSSSGPAAYITTQADNSAGDGRTFINSFYPVTLAREGWDAWEKTGAPLHEDGRAFLNPIRDTIVCSHSYSFEARGPRIVRTCTQCGIEDWVGIAVRNGEELVYTGSELRPCVMRNNSGGTYPFIPNEITYTNNRDAGTAVAKMSYRANGQLYVARLEFVISPRPVDAPDAAPELLFSTPYSLSVKAVPGLEYSINGTDWTASGVFTDLNPDTDYAVSVRTAAPEDRNYTHSVPAACTLAVHTDKEGSLGAPNWFIQSQGEGKVTLVNTGVIDTVTAVVAGYDANGRQTFLKMETISGGAGQTVTVEFADQSYRHKVFLLGNQSVPVMPAHSAAV